MARTTPISAVVRIALLGAALVGFLFAMLLAGSPEVHEWAHQDSGDTEHQCLATVLHAGACDDVTPASPLVVGAEGPLEVTVEGYSRVTYSLFLSYRILEHAPPAVS